MTDWHQIAVGVFVGLLAWRVVASIVGTFITVLARRSRLLTRLAAISKVKDAEFEARVARERRAVGVGIQAGSASYRYF